jgi:hypothetical protein
VVALSKQLLVPEKDRSQDGRAGPPTVPVGLSARDSDQNIQDHSEDSFTEVRRPVLPTRGLRQRHDCRDVLCSRVRGSAWRGILRARCVVAVPCSDDCWWNCLRSRDLASVLDRLRCGRGTVGHLALYWLSGTLSIEVLELAMKRSGPSDCFSDAGGL